MSGINGAQSSGTSSIEDALLQQIEQDIESGDYQDAAKLLKTASALSDKMGSGAQSASGASYQSIVKQLQQLDQALGLLSQSGDAGGSGLGDTGSGSSGTNSGDSNPFSGLNAFGKYGGGNQSSSDLESRLKQALHQIEAETGNTAQSGFGGAVNYSNQSGSLS